MSAKSHRTIDRLTEILEVVSSRRHGVTLAELAKETGAPKSSIQGFVNGLVYSGFLEKHERRYFIGPAPYVLTLRANRLPARTVAHDDLVDLHEASGCNVLLGVRVGQHVVYVDEVGDNASLQYVARNRHRRPLLTTAAGKSLVAFLDDRDLDALLPLHPDQEQVKAVLDEIDDIRANGYVVNKQSPSSRTSAIGCPVRDLERHVVAAVALTGPPEQILPRQDELGNLLMRVTESWAARGTTS